MIQNLWSWLQGLVIQDCPESIAVCEFECRAPTCLRGEWERCYRRRRQADGLGQQVAEPPRLSTGPGGRGDRGRA